MILKIGDKGKAVEELQKKLNGFTFISIDEDSEFGVKTESAVKLFQTMHEVKPVDGIAGPKTMKALDEAIKKIEPVEIGQDLSKRLECHLYTNRNAHIKTKDGLSCPIELDSDFYLSINEGISSLFHQIVDYLDVEESERYQKDYDKNGKLRTYCNIYAYDYCSFTWAYLPRVYWKDRAFNRVLLNETITPIYGENVREYSANMLFDWLTNEGEKYHGWERVATAEELQKLVNQGHVGVISAQQSNRKRSGHISIVLPMTKEYKQKGYKVLQSQAGINNKKYFDRDWYRNPKYVDYGFFVNRSPK